MKIFSNNFFRSSEMNSHQNTVNLCSSENCDHPPAASKVNNWKREIWTRKIDFLLACVGASVGLANVWRFPFLCYKNGGGAFLIPYFTAVVFGGVPIFFLEASLGQFMTATGIGPWRICPLFEGIGYACMGIIFLMNCSYIIILTWALYYLFSSFATVLPWSHCDNPWNTPHCSTFRPLQPGNVSVGNSTMTVGLLQSITLPPTPIGALMSANATVNQTIMDPTTEFWEQKVLNLSDGVNMPGNVKWDLALCMLLAWIIVFLCIWKGIKTSGKVMYITATSPYILMVVLLVRGVTLDGAASGIKHYLLTDFERLQNPQVWADAGAQVMFSYAIGQGVIPTLGSYNNFQHNVHRDCILFAAVNSVTSLLAGFIVFSVLGYMAQNQGVSIKTVAESGPGLAFITYPEAIAQLPLSPLWSCLFFMMIIMLGIDSQFVGVEAIISPFMDMYPNFLRKGHHRQVFVAGVCAVSYLIGVSMVTDGGMYVFQLFDYFSSSRILLVCAFFECIAVAYIYGANRFYDNLEMMMGFHISPFIKICWMLLTPVYLASAFILGIYSYSELEYKRKTVTYHFPGWAIGIGWTLAAIPISFIPLVMIIKIATTKGTIVQRIKRSIRPRLRRHQIRKNEDLATIDMIVDIHSGTDIDTNSQENQQVTGKLLNENTSSDTNWNVVSGGQMLLDDLETKM